MIAVRHAAVSDLAKRFRKLPQRPPLIVPRIAPPPQGKLLAASKPPAGLPSRSKRFEIRKRISVSCLPGWLAQPEGKSLLLLDGEGRID